MQNCMGYYYTPYERGDDKKALINQSVFKRYPSYKDKGVIPVDDIQSPYSGINTRLYNAIQCLCICQNIIRQVESKGILLGNKILTFTDADVPTILGLLAPIREKYEKLCDIAI